MRCFLAVECPQEVKQKLVELQQGLVGLGSLKLVEVENMHLTLKFLGEVRKEKVKEIVDLWEGKDILPAFDVVVQGVGAFPSWRKPRVIWVGVGEGSSKVCYLADFIEGSLQNLGFPPDKRFHPHFTLARVKYIRDEQGLNQWKESNQDWIGGEFTVSEFKLMQSTLTPHGPQYTELAAFPLA